MKKGFSNKVSENASDHVARVISLVERQWPNLHILEAIKEPLYCGTLWNLLKIFVSNLTILVTFMPYL